MMKRTHEEFYDRGFRLSYTFTPGVYGSSSGALRVIGEELEKKDFDFEIVRITDLKNKSDLHPSVLKRIVVFTRPIEK
jgi:hypothetical protein